LYFRHIYILKCPQTNRKFSNYYWVPLQDLDGLSADARKMVGNLQKEVSTTIFGHLLSEYNMLVDLGLVESDLRQYFEEWCTNSVSIIDDSGVELFINEKHTRIFGYKPNELIGRNAFDVLFPEESKAIVKAKVALRKKGVSDTYEIKMVKKSGKSSTCASLAGPYPAVQGDILGSIAIAEDITREKELEDRLRRTNEELEAKVQKRTRELTISNYQMVNEIKERKLAEIAVKNSEKRFKDLFYSSPEGVFVEDFNGNIIDLNEAAAKLHGYSREEMIGAKCQAVFAIRGDREFSGQTGATDQRSSWFI
jgi:PAS domain S-box-containing protein